MTLRSGRVYRDIESETPIIRITATSSASGAMDEELQRLLQQLAADRVQPEREFDEQRKWREEEQVQQGKDRKRHDEETRAYLDLIAKLAETRKTDSTKPASLSVKLVPLGAEDDAEAYLVTFERIWTAHGIENRWAHFLAPQLTGKAQLELG